MNNKYFVVTDNDNITPFFGLKLVPGLNDFSHFYRNDESSVVIHTCTTDYMKKTKIDDKTFIWEASIPEYDPELKVCYLEYGHYSTNKIILHRRHPASEPETYEKLNIPMVSMDMASAKGFTKILDWWKKSGLPLKYSTKAIDVASYNGKVNSLQWWLESGLPLKYSKCAISYASDNCQVNVLQWWLESGLELKYEEDFLGRRSIKNRNEVIEWWYRSGLKWRPSADVITCVCGHGRMIYRTG